MALVNYLGGGMPKLEKSVSSISLYCWDPPPRSIPEKEGE